MQRGARDIIYMRRKLLMLFAVLCMVFSTAYCFGATVSIPDTTGGTGSNVEIPVEIDIPSGIVGFQFTVVFDSSVLEATDVVSGTLTQGWLIFYNTEVPGQIQVDILNGDLGELGNEAGSLAKLVFLVQGEADETTTLSFTEAMFYNSLAEEIPVTLQPGIFTADVRSGDINGDQSVNISDVILCLRTAIGLPVTIDSQVYEFPYPDWLENRADYNGSGAVDISDVILILRKSIGLD